MNAIWKPTIRIQLSTQETPCVQSSLFAVEQREPPCDHFATQIQQRLDSGYDKVCILCGAIVCLNDPSRS